MNLPGLCSKTIICSEVIRQRTTDSGLGSIVLNDGAVRQKRLAEALAEHGKFPMYGMPTRSPSTRGKARQHPGEKIEFASMDRDLDNIAIQEFAPGKFWFRIKDVILLLVEWNA